MKDNIRAIAGAYVLILFLSLVSVAISYIWEDAPYVITERLGKILKTILCFAVFLIFVPKDDEKI